MTAGDATKKNVHYLSADGGRVPNLGETRVHFETKERHRVNHVFQVADIKKPILSVDSLTKSGNEVRFHTGGGTITNNRTKKQIRFSKRGGVYVLEVLVAPHRKVERPTGPTTTNSGGQPGFTRQGAK